METSKLTIKVYGILKEAEYIQSKFLAEGLFLRDKEVFFEPLCHGMMENEWLEFIQELKQNQAELTVTPGYCLIFVNKEIIGNTESFVEWAYKEHAFLDFRPLSLHCAVAKEEYKLLLRNKKLFSDLLPKTCQNFKQLCFGVLEEKETHDPPLKLSYKGSLIHRVVKKGWIQGGDIIEGKGNNGWSIYGELFEDENYSVLHTKRGILGMANKGHHTNASQFYITLAPAKWMDYQYVAFGQVIEGLDLLNVIEDIPTYNERPIPQCIIENCGLYDFQSL
nr:probable inactive peptidyl-prolyl cis-trans isomerase-like 6 isoform X2 [Hydra vulgaris]